MNLLTRSEIQKFPDPLPGQVERKIARNQPGRVKFQGTYWPAQFYYPDCQATVLPDEPVTVVGIQGITLLVVPVNTFSQSQS